jgi:hypothetical protein
MSNPGVGLQMTSPRTFHDEHTLLSNMTPGPQSYDIQFKLSDREKRQNELLSRRYDKWKLVSRNNWDNCLSLGATKLNNTSCKKRPKTAGTRGTSTTLLHEKENNIGGVGLTMTSLRSAFGTNSSPSPPYCNVEFKLTNARKDKMKY